MKHLQANPGRTFIIHFEDGEILHDEIEDFTRELVITPAAVIAVGAADESSKLLVGPEHERKLSCSN